MTVAEVMSARADSTEIRQRHVAPDFINALFSIPIEKEAQRHFACWKERGCAFTVLLQSRATPSLSRHTVWRGLACRATSESTALVHCIHDMLIKQMNMMTGNAGVGMCTLEGGRASQQRWRVCTLGNPVVPGSLGHVGASPSKPRTICCI